MAEVLVDNPFGREPLADVPLANAPLVGTLAQIRFASVTTLKANDTTANAFAVALAEQFPVFEASRETTVTITPEGVQQSEGEGRIWHLRSADDAWRVNFAPTFLSLDTPAYTSREDFCERLAKIWLSFTSLVTAPSVTRIGFRYINRVSDQAILAKLPDLVRPEVLGVSALAASGGDAWIAQSLSDNVFVLRSDEPGAHTLQARFGLIPAGVSVDQTLAALETHSWVLDIDSARSFGELGVAGVDAVETVRELGQAGYRFFRWTVNADFLRAFGGDV